MKLTATVVPHSSVVGSSVSFQNESGAVVALCILTVPNPQFDYKEIALPLAKQIAAMFSEPTDEMLNAAQSRLCEIENITYFNDYHQAEMFKAMVDAAAEPKRFLTEG